MKTAIAATAVLALAMGLQMTAPAPVKAQSCGVKPIRPIPPVGCRDLEAECVCNAAGTKCGWQWRCVK